MPSSKFATKAKTTKPRYTYHKDGTSPKDGTTIFVFGSNLAARHGGGAAKAAEDYFGASRKIAIGMSGQSYAIPTKDEDIETLPLPTIKKHVRDFVKYAEANPGQQFFMTRIGCVLAGYTNEDIAPMFKGAPYNIDFPEEWKQFIEK